MRECRLIQVKVLNKMSSEIQWDPAKKKCTGNAEMMH